MIAPGVDQIERSAAELDRPLAVHDLIRNHHVRSLELHKALLGAAMGDHCSAGILEHLAAGNVVVVMVAVDQVLDRRLRDFADFVEVGLGCLRAAVADRVGDDHACRRDNEHGLMVLVAENVDVVGAVDLRSLEHRPLRLRRRGRGETSGEDSYRKGYESSALHGWYLPLTRNPGRGPLIPAPKTRTVTAFRLNSKAQTRTHT